MIGLIVSITALVIVFAFLSWVIEKYMPADFKKWATLVLYALGVCVLLYILYNTPWQSILHVR